MTVPSLKHRAVKIEIDNRRRKERANQEQTTMPVDKPITEEEHQKRLAILKEQGITI